MPVSAPLSFSPWPRWLALACLPGIAWAGTEATTAASPVAVPAQWRAEAPVAGALDPAALVHWWERFDDTVLTQLVENALRSSPDVRTALAKIESARASHGIQRASLLPSLTGDASGRRTRTRVHDTDVVTNADSAGASLDAGWEIDLFGKQRKAFAATAADLAQAEENLRDAQVTLAAEVASTYVSLRAAEANLAATQRSLATREESLQLARWREQVGATSSLDTQQAVTTVEQARASVPALQQSILETRNRLAVLCGQTPGSLDTLLAPARAVPAAPAAIAVGIPAETLRQRPDVRAAGRAVEAAAARTSSAKRDRFPTLKLTGSLGVDALDAGKLFSPETTVANLVGSLTAPIFAGGRIHNTIALRSAAEKQVLIAYESAVLTALSEVENALSAVRRQSERLAALATAAAAARDASALARQEYEAGAVDFLTVLDAERTALGVEQQQVSATADLTTAHIQLYKALGGGWTNL
jgi:NodT family efflux transporter outer membrane factor (OMF) lipoprotein